MPRNEEFQDKIHIPRVTRRDFEIYEFCRVRGKTQREAADKFRISQARISKVIERVTEYYSLPDPTERGLSRQQRARAAARLYEQRLDYGYDQSLAGWEVSLDSHHRVEQTSKVTPAEGTVPTKTPEKEKRTATGKKPDPRFLAQMEKFATMRIKFEGFDERGNIDVSDKGRLLDIPDKQHIIANRELKKAAFQGDFDTEGDIDYPDWVMDGVGATHYMDGRPYVSKKGLTTNSEATEKDLSPNSDSDEATRNGALSKNAGAFCEEVVVEAVTEKNAVQKVLSKGLSSEAAEVVDARGGVREDDGCKSVEIPEEVTAELMGSPVAILPLTPALSPEYRGEGEKTGRAMGSPVASQPLTPALSPEYRGEGEKTEEPKLPGRAVFEFHYPRLHSENFPELPYLARQAIQTLADNGYRVMPRPAAYVDPPPEPERLMPDGLPWARSEEEARRRGYCQWTTDRTPEEEAEWQFRHLPQACQKAYNLLDVLDVEVVPVPPYRHRLG
jgi:hypothetical protein